MAAWSAQSLVVHHFAHWLLVVAGAIVGYQLRDRVNIGGRAPVAWIGLVVTLVWHLPPALQVAESSLWIHMLAHASLLAGGGALGWAAPRLGGAGRAFLLIAGSVVMWPIVLAELAGVFSYPNYPGQSATAGVAEMIAMSCLWLVLAFGAPLGQVVGRPAVLLSVQGVMVALLLIDWMAR